MTTDILLQLVLAALSHTAELNALLEKVKGEGRTDLTEEEVSLVEGRAQASLDKLSAELAKG